MGFSNWTSKLLTWPGGCEVAVTERVACESFRTRAHGHVVVDSAEGSDAARSQARISALLACAGEIHGAVGVDATLWATVWRGSRVSWQTGAGWSATDIPALCVRAAGRWDAGVCRG